MSRMLRRYLEKVSDTIEATLRAQGVHGRITGGMVGPRVIRLTFAPAQYVTRAAVCQQAETLRAALGAPNLRVMVEDPGDVVLTIPNPEPRPITLLGLWPEVQPLPQGTGMLGLTEDGAPLLAMLPSAEIRHLLVTGANGAGKSTLLRTLAVSLALGHTPAALRLAVVDVGGGRAFRPLVGAAHLLRAPVVTQTEALELFTSLGRLAGLRARQNERAPFMVVVVDNAELLSDAARAQLEALVNGPRVGVHVIAATAAPERLQAARFPLRVVGQVETATAARLAAGQAETGAEELLGQGDFLAVPEGARPLHFQAAYIGEHEARAALAAPPAAGTDSQGAAFEALLEARPVATALAEW